MDPFDQMNQVDLLDKIDQIAKGWSRNTITFYAHFMSLLDYVIILRTFPLLCFYQGAGTCHILLVDPIHHLIVYLSGDLFRQTRRIGWLFWRQWPQSAITSSHAWINDSEASHSRLSCYPLLRCHFVRPFQKRLPFNIPSTMPPTYFFVRFHQQSE